LDAKNAKKIPLSSPFGKGGKRGDLLSPQREKPGTKEWFKTFKSFKEFKPFSD
jgi:hypothetical protein